MAQLAMKLPPGHLRHDGLVFSRYVAEWAVWASWGNHSRQELEVSSCSSVMWMMKLLVNWAEVGLLVIGTEMRTLMILRVFGTTSIAPLSPSAHA